MVNNVANQYQEFMQRMLNVNNQMFQNSLQTALQGTNYSLQNLLLTNAALLAQKDIEYRSTIANTQMDASALAQRAMFTQVSKALDQWTHAEMIRERIYNTFIDLERTRTDNTLKQAKNAVSSARY